MWSDRSMHTAAASKTHAVLQLAVLGYGIVCHVHRGHVDYLMTISHEVCTETTFNGLEAGDLQ